LISLYFRYLTLYLSYSAIVNATFIIIVPPKLGVLFHINAPNISLIIIYLTSYIFNHVLRHPLPLLPPLSCIVRMPFAPSKCVFWLCVTPSPILPCSPTPKPQQWDTNAQQKLLVLGSCPKHFATPLCHYE